MRTNERPSDDYESAAALRRGLRTFLGRTAQITRKHGLTPERYELLLLVKVSLEGHATISRLAEQLSIGQSAATQLVRRAEDLGLLTRALSSRDARIRLLQLTDEGERRLAGAVTELGHEREALRALLTETAADNRPAAEVM